MAQPHAPTIGALVVFLAASTTAFTARAQDALPPGTPAPAPLAPAAAPAPTSVPVAAAPPVVELGPTPLSPEPVLVAPAASEIPTAGYHNGTFYIRSTDDIFRLYILARVHSDWIDQIGPGTSNLPPGSNLNDGFFLRRARMELGGEFYQTWQWQVGAEFSSSTSIDNAAATTTSPVCVANPTTGALPCTDNTNAAENPTVKPIPTDVFINFGPLPWANLEVGQFYLPFTLENRISDNTTPFLERSMAVRNIGAPLQRDIGAMAWGESPNRVFYYTVALLNGDGPNRVNVDSRYEVAGRVVVRPFAASTTSPTKWAQIGFSARESSADPSHVGYDLPALTTQDGFAFWKPTYKDSSGRLIHIIPSSAQWGLAGDVFLPIQNFDFTGEFLYVVDNTREAVDGYQLSPFTERAGALKGYGWYAQAGYWLLGNHDIIGYPSYGRPIHVDLKTPQNPPQQGVQVLAKFEQLHLDYNGNSRGGALDSKTPQGAIIVDDVEVGLNYWATRHLRVGVNYTLYVFPDSAPVSATTAGSPQQSAAQRAVAPGQLLAKGADDGARDHGHTLNEISARVGVQF
jgi:phosphate-selective porin